RPERYARSHKTSAPKHPEYDRPLEPETADSVTDSAEESQAGAALGSQESAGVNAEQRHLTTSHGNSKLKLQYLLILAPTLVIALMFLFFWLFMKETSYDEVLARQKRDLKLPPSKPDTRKKNDKKKSKKKESASGGGGGRGGGESEEDLQDFDLADGTNAMEVEEEPTPVATPDPSRDTYSLRAGARDERIQAGEPQVRANSVCGQTVQPPSPQLEVEVQVQSVQAPVQAQTPPQTSGKKKDKKKQKAEPGTEAKSEQAPVKKEAPIVAETKVLDGATPVATSGKKKNSSKKQKTEHVDEAHVLADLAASANHQAVHNDEAPAKGSGKKQKNETDKENTGVKLKELLSGLSSLALSEAEAVSVMTLLREKSPNALDACFKSAARPDPALQERERLLTTVQEEASIAKDKVKQLSQELHVEKQKTSRVEAVMRTNVQPWRKNWGACRAKPGQLPGAPFQQVREQLESQITRLQQENGILRDAVSSATNQMESKNSAELNNLRSEYTGLMKELADNNSKLQQEEHQRKSLEVNYKQNVSQLEAQLQDAKRSWEELQKFLHNVNAEREKLQASNQDLHSQLVAVETEMNNKNKEIQTIHSSLTEAMVSKERLEQRVMELMEMSQHSMPDDVLQGRVQDLINENQGLQVVSETLQVQNEALQVQNEALQAQISTQVTHVSHFDELQKLLAEKELQRKSLEDSLNAERSGGATRETSMQALHNDNMSMKAEVQNLQNLISDQTASQIALDQFQMSVREKEDNMKTVEDLLEKGLIEVANKEEELKVIQEKDVKLKSVEESLQTAQESSSTREKAVEALEQQLAALQTEMEQLRQKETTQVSSSDAELQQLHAQLAAKDQEIQMLQAEMEARTKAVSEQVEQMEQMQQQQSQAAVPSTELLSALTEKDKQVSDLQAELAELRDSVELHRKKNNENQTALEMCQAECRDVLQRLLPHVPLPSEQNHQEWLHRFEGAVAESSAALSTPASGDSERAAEKLKEAEEAQKILQKDCETYKKVLAETEGILQRLQNSVEQEESRWKVKLEASQGELKEMNQKVTLMDQEIERLTEGAELENLRREKQHLESELERAEQESATYVTEVRELKTQLTETLSKLETEESERQKVAGDLYTAQQSLDLIQGELSKVTENADGLIENSSLSSQTEEIDRKEKMTAGLNQTVRELQQLLQGVSRKLTKREEEEADKGLPKVYERTTDPPRSHPDCTAKTTFALRSYHLHRHTIL
ncbi:hypothetical protein F7725_007997, partial [Dissostichus mawsoni]